jgi:hypothetical protein
MMVRLMALGVLCAVFIALDAEAGSPFRWSSSLVLNPQCASLCTLREFRAGKVGFRTTIKPGTNGLLIDVSASGLVKEGESRPANGVQLRLRLGLSYGGRQQCDEYVSQPLTTKDGRVSAVITGRQLQPVWDKKIGTVTVCSVVLDDLAALEQGLAIIGGLILGGSRGFQ